MILPSPGSATRYHAVCSRFRPGQFMPRICSLYPENYLVSSLNDCCKRKETLQKGKLESSRIHFSLRPRRATGPHSADQHVVPL